MDAALSDRRRRSLHELTRRLKAEGLMEPTPTWYLLSLVGWCGLHLLLLMGIAAGIDPWLSAALVLIDAPVVLRISLLVHDLGHGAGGARPWIKRQIPGVVWPLMVGFSVDFWRSFHVRHHAFNNVATRAVGDPTTDFAPFVLGTQQWPQSSLISRNQGALFWLATPLLALGLIARNLGEVLARVVRSRGRDGRAVADLLLLTVGHGVHLGVSFVGHTLWVGLALQLLRITVHSAWIKISLALNHIGMKTFEAGGQPDPLTEVALTTRNFNGGAARLFSWVLCWQIEHHLWPRMSALHLPRAAELTREVFQREGLTYVDVSLSRAFIHAAAQLHRLGRGLPPAHIEPAG